MRCTPIEDYCRPNSMFYGLGRRFKLRNHATCSCAIRDEVRNRVHRNLAHQILVLVQNTSHVRQQEQAARPEGRRKRTRGRVRIHIIAMPVFTHADWRDHGNEL